MKGETPLHLAAMKGDAAALVALVEQGADCSAKDNAGWTPLHEACNFGHVEIVKILLDNGVSVNIPGFENNVPLHDAVINNHVQVVELLILSGANPNARYTLYLRLCKDIQSSCIPVAMRIHPFKCLHQMS